MQALISKMKNTLGRISNKLVFTDKKIGELKDTAIEILQSETCREKDNKKF